MSVIEQDVIVMGAGAAGLMAAASAAARGRRVCVLEHGKRPGRKILISGGGRCNFTNYYIEPERYLSQNPHFCKSAFAQYTQWDFIALVEKYGIPYHEKTLGQLFCDNSAKDIVNLLLAECALHKVALHYASSVQDVTPLPQGGFAIKTTLGVYHCQSLIVATGGLPMPRLGATPFAFELAKQFNLPVVPPRAGLVPFTLNSDDKTKFAALAGVSLPVEVTCGAQSFRENLLFTHRGVSGPAILQISSYWQPGETVCINFVSDVNLETYLHTARKNHPSQELKTTLSHILPKRLVETLISLDIIDNQPLKRLTEHQCARIAQHLHTFELKPNGTEGYRTAEVSLGGVSTEALSSKTMQVKTQPHLFFIGEAVDVTGWLGGYNFQWAWSSGWVAGQHA